MEVAEYYVAPTLPNETDHVWVKVFRKELDITPCTELARANVLWGKPNCWD